MKIELEYVKVGDYYFPALALEPQPDLAVAAYSDIDQFRKNDFLYLGLTAIHRIGVCESGRLLFPCPGAGTAA